MESQLSIGILMYVTCLYTAGLGTPMVFHVPLGPPPAGAGFLANVTSSDDATNFSTHIQLVYLEYKR